VCFQHLECFKLIGQDGFFAPAAGNHSGTNSSTVFPGTPVITCGTRVQKLVSGFSLRLIHA